MWHDPLETPVKLAAAMCFLQLATTLGAAEPALVRLALSEGKDIALPIDLGTASP